jgi:hypothetical protein
MMLREHKNKVDYKTRYFYNEFKKVHSGLDLTEVQFTTILKTFFNVLVEKIVKEAFRLKITSIGSFYLVKIKQKIYKNKEGKAKIDSSINWPATKELIKLTGDKTKKVYYINDHTNRFVYRITWDKYMVDFVNKTYYTFIINKKHRQFLNNAILTSDKQLNAYEEWYH